MEEQEYATTAGQRAGDALMVIVRLLVFIPALDLGLALGLIFLARALGMAEAVKQLSEVFFLWMLLAAVPLAWFAAVSGKYWRITLHEDGVIAVGPGRRKKVAFAALRLLRLLGGQQPESQGKKALWVVRLEAVVGAPVCIYLRREAARELFGRLRDRSPHAAAIDENGKIYEAKSDPDGSAKKKLAKSLGLRGLAVLTSGLVTLGFAVFGHGAAPDALEAGRQIALRGLALIYGGGALVVGLRLLGQLGSISREGKGAAR